MVVPLLLVFMPVSTGLALFLPKLALGVVATLSFICGVRINDEVFDPAKVVAYAQQATSVIGQSHVEIVPGQSHTQGWLVNVFLL